MKIGKSKHVMVITVIMVMLAALFAGCSKNNTIKESPAASSSSASSPNASSSEPSAEPVVELTPITYTMNTANDKATWDTPIAKALTEKTGITLKYDLTVGDETQKHDLWLAAGDYPDIMAVGPASIKKYQDAGALIPLNDLIDQYGPHIKEKFGKYYNLLKDDEGKIWSLYGINLSQEAAPDATAPFIVQYDVLKEAGFPEVRTIDQLYDLIKAYKDKHPKIDGKDTIGFTSAMQGWLMNIQFNNPIVSASGLPDHGNFRIDATGNVEYNPVSEDAKTYYKFLNKMFVNGLYDKEAFTQDTLEKKLAQGRVLAAYVPNWLLGTVETALRAEGKPERAYARLPIFLNEGTVDNTNMIRPTFAGSQQWSITTAAKNPERFIQFIDYLFSDEGQILTQWGLEGIHYEMKDGHRAVTAELLEKRKNDPDTDVKEGFYSEGTGGGYWFTTGPGSKLGDGDYATPLTKEYVISKYDDMTKEVLAQYGKQVWADFLQPAQITAGYLWQLTPPETVSMQAAKVDEAWRKYLPKLIMASSETNFDKEWVTMLAAMEKGGLQDVNGAYTELWAAFNEKFKATIGG
jgi:putative aldouronate transport system substrate-binding protein